MRDLIITKFSGGLASEAKLPAYEATKSLHGISRSLLIVTHYLAAGRIQKRFFDSRAVSSEYELNILTSRPGSFETVFELVTNPTTMAIGAGLVSGISANFLTDFIKSIFNRTIGGEAESEIENLEQDGQLNSGDNSALVEAIEPAFRSAHNAIGSGSSEIVIINGDNNIVNLNGRTKNYINKTIRDDEVKIALFSVGSFNANSGYGRAFDFREGRTVPFILDGGSDRETVKTILDSMRSYTFKRRMGDDLQSAVAFRYTSFLSIDDRLKKMTILKARPDLDALSD